MAYRPADWHVLDLDKDPTPGDPQRVRMLARSLQDFADDVGNALRQITTMASEDVVDQWSGRSAKKFKEEFDGVPANLRKLRTSYEMAGDAITDYWPKLERAQALADRALFKGREARADLTAAQGRLDSAGDWVKTAAAQTKANDEAKGPQAPDESKVRAATRNAQQAESAQDNAQRSVDSAQSELDAAKAMAQEARELREEASRVCQGKLDEASDAGIQNRSWWEDAVHFVTDNWDTIVAVCKVVVTVVGIVAMIIGGPILAIIVVVAAVIVLADTLNKYAKGEAGLFDVGMAALDCIPGMKGLTTLAGAAKGLKAMSKGLRSGGLRNGLKNLPSKAKPAAGRCKNGDPIDMVSGEMIMEESDLSLPGVLPLVLRRTHLSTYQWGRCFGDSWASTLDQRVELDAEGAVFATEDGMLLSYPVPAPGGDGVLPKAGPHWPLKREADGSLTVTDPQSGLTRRFVPAMVIPAQRDDSRVEERPETLLLASIRDRNGNEITFAHDAAGMPTEVRHSGGYHVAVDTTDGRITGLRLLDADEGPAGHQVRRFAYDEQANLDGIYNSSGLPLQLTYDIAARITSWTDRIGAWYRYTYDAEDRVVQGEGVNGILNCTITYDDGSGSGTTRYRNSLGQVTTYEHNDRFQLIAETDALGNTVRQDYDEHDRLLYRTDALGNTTAYAYDGDGNIIRVTRPDGRRSTAVYNALALPVSVTGFDGRTWGQEYDERGNCLTLTAPDGNSTHRTYDGNGRLTTMTDVTGAVTRIRSDEAGLPLEISDPLGATARYAYDTFGRRTTLVDPLGATSHARWSAEGQTLMTLASDGTSESWTYDGEGNCLTRTDPMGRVSRFEYGPFDLLSARTGPDGARFEFAHDTELRLTQVTNPLDLTWTYEFDATGRLVSETDFDDRVQRYEIDAAGDLTARVTPLGGRITFERDILGRTVRKDAAGRTTTFTFDERDRLLEAINPDTTMTLRYDDQGRVLSETVNGRELAYHYDGFGRRVGRTTPSGAQSIWTHDEAGRRDELMSSGHRIRFTHDEAGQETGRSIGEGLTLSHSYDSMGRRTGQTVTGVQGRIRHRDYQYRADGNLVRIDDTRTGTRTFDLDANGRVTGVAARNWTETYAYDAMGNQTRADWPEKHPGSEARGDRNHVGTRISRAGRVRYEYDAAGRTTLRQKARLSAKPDTWRYEWDVEDRLTGVVTPDGTRWTYEYDAIGRRTIKQRMEDGGVAVAERVDFTWDGAALCEQTTHSHGDPRPVTLTWDHQGHRPLAQTERRTGPDRPASSDQHSDDHSADAGTPSVPACQEEIDSRFYAIVTDLVGTPTELLDENGETAWHTRSTLWGTTAWSVRSSTYTPLRFPGQYYDPETQLHYNYFRHYDPETTHYLTPDPLGLAPAPNPTAYVENPNSWVDFLGLNPCYSEIAPNGQRGPAHATVTPQTLDDAANGLIGSAPGRGARYAPAGFQGGGAGHSRGHLIGQQFGGDGRDMRNIVTQGTSQNNGPISDAENLIADHVRATGNTVHMSVTPEYANGGEVASHVLIEAVDDAGWSFSTRLSNM